MDTYLFLGNTNVYVNIAYILLGTILFFFSMKVGYYNFNVPKFKNYSLVILSFLFALGAWIGCSIIGAFIGLFLLINTISPYLILRQQNGFIEEANRKGNL